MTPSQQDKLLRKISLTFARKIKTEINRYIETVARAHDRETGAPDKYFPEHKANLKHLWEKSVKSTIKTFGENVKIESPTRSYTWTHIRTTPKGYNTLFDYLYSQWVQKNGGKHITNIAETTRRKIKSVIAEKTKDEVNTADISTSIREVKAFSPYRARVIALTETHAAAQYSSHETAVQLEADNDLLVYKEWIPIEDERTRASHAEMADHEPILLHEDFDVDGVAMERPSDERGGAENVINCRCSLVFSTDE